jgi:hypothetical protein
VHWQGRRGGTGHSIVLGTVLGIREVQLEHWYRRRTWVWVATTDDARAGELSFHPRQAGFLLEALASDDVPRAHRRPKV